ncbi:MAG TPA: hypothetical protein VGL83_16145 [Stellaceae bacterium]|jgi:hypothetical protein
MILPRRRDVLAAGAASLLLPALTLPAAGAGEAPAATGGTGWGRKSSWNFGTAPGNNVASFAEWLGAGWFMDETPRYLNDECETYNTTDRTNGNANFMPFADHCDIVAIWNGGPIASAQGNGSISSLMVRYDVPAPNAVGYYELTCKIPSVSGAWPAWWTVGHAPGSPQGASTWGPEIDVLEFYDANTTLLTSTLHGSTTPSYCFLRRGGYPPGTPQTPSTVYDGKESWDMGHFTYRPGADFSQAYHRFGAKIAADYSISIWVDDVPIGVFAADQYCDDRGRPVAVELLVNLALGTRHPDPVRSIRTADFGGAGNRGAANKFRLSLKNIQIWGPA